MRKSLIQWCSENDALYLLEEWDTEINGPLNEKISYGSERKVTWKCKKGHRWVTTIGQRTNSRTKCPYCSGRLAIPNATDLLTLYPEIAKEWDYQKNTKLPINVKAGSHDKVWWKCSVCGNEWQAVISSRTNGCGCPKCGIEKRVEKSKVPKKGRSLAEARPELLVEWNEQKNKELTPDKVSAGTHDKVWWKCKKGHEWEASVSNRVKGRNCPYCSNKMIISGYNDFATIYPELVKEWNYEKNVHILPTNIAPSSSKKVWWKCKSCGHEWITSVNNRIKRGCPQCAKARTVSFPEKVIFYYMTKVFDDVEENYRPSFLEGREIDIFIPQIKVAIEYDGTLYHQNVERDLFKQEKCNDNGVMVIRVREPGCPSINVQGYVIQLQNRDLSSYEQMVQDILTILKHENMTKFEFLDVNLSRDMAEIYDLVNFQALEDSILNTNPELIEFWNDEKNTNFTMDKVSYASDKKVWWKCPECENEWIGSIYSMTRKKGENLCPKCTKKNKSLMKRNPELIPFWDNQKNKDIFMDEVTHTSLKVVWWKCPECQHEWEKSIRTIADKRRKNICPNCKKIE